MNPKIDRLFAAFCWLGTLVVALLALYMLHMAQRFPEIEVFARNTRIVGALLLLWLAIAAYFTVRARRNGKKRDK